MDPTEDGLPIPQRYWAILTLMVGVALSCLDTALVNVALPRIAKDLNSSPAPIDGHKGSADRHYCKRCGTPLWVSDEQWPELVHPFASVIDTELPKAPSSVHLLLRDKASWVEPQIGPNDDCFDGYPELSIEDWHKKHGLWIE
jgi:hypothetical protein